MSIISFEQYVAGQKASVISDVNSLITTFLKDKRTIILAVIPANQVYIHLIDDSSSILISIGHSLLFKNCPFVNWLIRLYIYLPINIKFLS